LLFLYSYKERYSELVCKIKGDFAMNKVKIQILLVVLLCNGASMHGMVSAARTSAVKVSRSYKPSKDSFWAKVSSAVSRWWKSLSNPKTHYARVGRLQAGASKNMQKDVSTKQLDQQDKQVAKTSGE
jgi:hypothetical protein